ncbi:MAG: hypothetical protein KF690_03535 [Bacteroidetes bacterium]|nr:hypothetical protein [Bacteroidota bacterium]
MKSRGLLTLVCLLLAGLLWQCGPIERQEVPVWLGLRLNRNSSPDTFRKDLAAIQALGGRGLAIELLVEPDSTGLPRLSPQSLQEWEVLVPILREKPLPLTLVFTHDQFHPLFQQWDHSRRVPWFRQFGQVLIRFLEQIPQELAPERVVAGNRFDRIAHYRVEWDSLFLRLRPHTRARLTYAAHLPEIERFHSWNHCDEIGVNYPDSDADNQKMLAQERNPQLAALAQRYGKPIFIANANLIGDQKLLKLKNRLRFYGDAQLSGLVLNNIFPQTVLTDTSSYFFGLKHEPEV